MYKGIQSEVISTTSLDEKSGLSAAYLGRIFITRFRQKDLGRRTFFYIRTRVYDRKAIGWNRMSDIIEYRNEQIIYV